MVLKVLKNGTLEIEIEPCEPPFEDEIMTDSEIPMSCPLAYNIGNSKRETLNFEKISDNNTVLDQAQTKVKQKKATTINRTAKTTELSIENVNEDRIQKDEEEIFTKRTKLEPIIEDPPYSKKDVTAEIETGSSRNSKSRKKLSKNNLNTLKTCVVCSKNSENTSFSRRVTISKRTLLRYERHFGRELSFGDMCNNCFMNWDKSVYRVCQVCKRSSKEVSFSIKATVSASTIDKYEKFFERTLSHGSLCVSCYLCYRNHYKTRQTLPAKRRELLEKLEKERNEREKNEKKETKICVVCGGKTNSTLKVSNFTLKRYESCFERKLPLGPLCKPCYNIYYEKCVRKRKSKEKFRECKKRRIMSEQGRGEVSQESDDSSEQND